MIRILARAKTPSELEQGLCDAFKLYNQALDMLKNGEVDLHELVINGKVSFALETYKATTPPSVRAARQMEVAGMTIKPGQRVRFFVHQGGRAGRFCMGFEHKSRPFPVGSGKIY